jgi:hypothetical protein
VTVNCVCFIILGMEMFGCKFCNVPRPSGCERPNDVQRRMTYDTLFKAMVTTFQVFDVVLVFD